MPSHAVMSWHRIVPHRRTACEAAPDTGLFEPEYVNVFGVPFTFLPHEGGEDGPPPPPEPKTAIEPDRDKAAFEIRWPNVVRIDRVFRPRLTLDWEKVEPLTLDASQTARLAELAPVVEGKPDMTLLAAIDLERLARELRIQRIVFETARDVYDAMQADWSGSREVLLAQLVRLVERFLRSGRIVIEPRLFAEDDLKRRLMLALNMTRAVHSTGLRTCGARTVRAEPPPEEHARRPHRRPEAAPCGRLVGSADRSCGLRR